MFLKWYHTYSSESKVRQSYSFHEIWHLSLENCRHAHACLASGALGATMEARASGGLRLRGTVAPQGDCCTSGGMRLRGNAP